MTGEGLLTGIDDVPWSSFEHAYAIYGLELPQVLRTIADGDDASRDKAIGDLVGSICHQGDVYEAAAPAVPFIVELVSRGQMSSLHRRILVALLGWLAAGEHAVTHDAVAAVFPEVLGRLAGARPQVGLGTRLRGIPGPGGCPCGLVPR